VTLTIKNSQLCFSTYGIDGDVRISLKRTIRLPDNGYSHGLPPGLGNFELLKVEDYKHKLASHIVEKGGVFCCMYPYEALWLDFDARDWRPSAIMVASGMINALTGERWTEDMRSHPQNYCVTGGGISGASQPWIDGWMTDPVRKDVRQFVAAELGRGETVEEQITGKAEFGGLQLKVFEVSNNKFSPARPRTQYSTTRGGHLGSTLYSKKSYSPGMAMSLCADTHERGIDESYTLGAMPASMGLAAGAKINQQIHLDTLSLHDWNQNGEKVFVHLFNPAAWEQITGRKAPVSPVTLEQMYTYGWKREYIILHYPHWFMIPTVVQVPVQRPTTSHNPVSPLAYVKPVDPNAVKPGIW